MDVYEIVLYEVDQAFYPTLKFRWGAHDAHKWDLSLEAFEADRVAGWPLLKAVRDIVQQTFVVNGRPTQFKADFHIMYDNGRVEPWAV